MTAATTPVPPAQLDADRRRRLSSLFGYAAMVVVIVIIGCRCWIVVT
ncbi:hypothetical protein [Rhodococcoides corynebacterioides]|nr:hypothetical protein [Rhodococcus corynebacterioides]